MKKLLVLAGTVATIATVRAAAVTWGTSAFQTPTEDGTYSSTQVADGSVHGYLWEVEKATYDTFVANLTSVYTEFSKVNHGTLGATTKDAVSAVTGKVSLQGDDGRFASGETAYGILLYTYQDGDGKDWYVANAAQYSTMGKLDVSVGKLNAFVGGSIDSVAQGAAITGWQSVPEPFSGTLVLVGMAGLALRRKLKKQKKA